MTIIDVFERDGFVRLAGAVPAADVAAMADAVWAELAARHGVQRYDPATWAPTATSRLGRLRRRDAFAALGSPVVRAAVTEVAGSCRPVDWGGPLVTFPEPGPWAVPRGGWHLDVPVRGAPETTLAVKWLGYLEPVRPHAGGTAVLAGSHRLVATWQDRTPGTDPGRSPDVRDAIFALDPWFRVLTGDQHSPQREAVLTTGARVDGVDVRVVELHGEAGDVVLLHRHLLHAAAPNSGSAARVMVTGGVYEAR
jgi:hypothetical protein